MPRSSINCRGITCQFRRPMNYFDLITHRAGGICDRLAIGLGIWEISPQYTTGWHLFGLPIEEAVFFLITNLMVVQGLALVRVPFAVLRTAGRRPSGALSTTMPGSS